MSKLQGGLISTPHIDDNALREWPPPKGQAGVCVLEVGLGELPSLLETFQFQESLPFWMGTWRRNYPSYR